MLIGDLLELFQEKPWTIAVFWLAVFGARDLYQGLFRRSMRGVESTEDLPNCRTRRR